MSNLVMYVLGKSSIECALTQLEANSLPKSALEHYKRIGAVLMKEKEAWKLIDDADEKNLCKPWKEISEEDYNHFLAILPPSNWNGDCFYMSEMYTSNITSHYIKHGNKYYTALRRIRPSWDFHTDELQKQLYQSTQSQD